MRLFQIDYRRLVVLLLPTFLRRSRMYAFLTGMVFGVEELHRRFTRSRDANLLRLRRNGQVCYLRALLNDELDAVQRRIRLDDASQPGEWVMIYDENASYQTLVGSERGYGGNPISNSISNVDSQSGSGLGLVGGLGSASVRGSGYGSGSVSGFRSASNTQSGFDFGSGTDSVSVRGLGSGADSVSDRGLVGDLGSGAVHILYDEGSILENTSFFTVTVPWNAKMEDSTNRLRSLLNEYKLLSKTYLINYANE